MCLRLHELHVVLQTRQHAANLVHARRMDVGVNDARCFSTVREDLPPRIDDERVAKGLPAVLVAAISPSRS